MTKRDPTADQYLVKAKRFRDRAAGFRHTLARVELVRRRREELETMVMNLEGAARQLEAMARGAPIDPLVASLAEARKAGTDRAKAPSPSAAGPSAAGPRRPPPPRGTPQGELAAAAQTIRDLSAAKLNNPVRAAILNNVAGRTAGPAAAKAAKGPRKRGA